MPYKPRNLPRMLPTSTDPWREWGLDYCQCLFRASPHKHCPLCCPLACVPELHQLRESVRQTAAVAVLAPTPRKRARREEPARAAVAS
jgi:hypothetical protein